MTMFNGLESCGQAAVVSYIIATIHSCFPTSLYLKIIKKKTTACYQGNAKAKHLCPEDFHMEENQHTATKL